MLERDARAARAGMGGSTGIQPGWEAKHEAHIAAVEHSNRELLVRNQELQMEVQGLGASLKFHTEALEARLKRMEWVLEEHGLLEV